MTNGFLEFGLLALLAFGYVNLLFGWVIGADLPPLARKGVGVEGVFPRLRRAEEGVPTDGAELVVPEIKRKTPVA